MFPFPFEDSKSADWFMSLHISLLNVLAHHLYSQQYNQIVDNSSVSLFLSSVCWRKEVLDSIQSLFF